MFVVRPRGGRVAMIVSYKNRRVLVLGRVSRCVIDDDDDEGKERSKWVRSS